MSGEVRRKMMDICRLFAHSRDVISERENLREVFFIECREKQKATNIWCSRVSHFSRCRLCCLFAWRWENKRESLTQVPAAVKMQQVKQWVWKLVVRSWNSKTDKLIVRMTRESLTASRFFLATWEKKTEEGEEKGRTAFRKDGLTPVLLTSAGLASESLLHNRLGKSSCFNKLHHYTESKRGVDCGIRWFNERSERRKRVKGQQ